MFYKCQKCEKTWQYPIEKCPECFSVLEKISSEKIKVVGISRVVIPTMLHPKVPYFVLVLQDESGNKWIQKSVKEYQIGEDFKIETTDNNNAVAIWRIKYDILEGIEKIIKLVGGLNVNSDSKALILPTLNSPKHPHLAENTSPQFLENTIKYLTEQGIKTENIKVAGQSFDDILIKASVQKSQLLKVCQDCKVLPLDLAKTNFIKKGEGDFAFDISEEAFKADLVINLPILKIGKAAASENMLKFLKKANYLSLKYLHSEEEIICNLHRILPQHLTLAEAQSVQKPDKFVTHLNLIFNSFNSLNLDRVFAEVSMVKNLPETIKKVKIEDITIIGRAVEELQYETEKY